MYSHEERMRAIALYIQYDCSSAATIRELGYPSRKGLYRWYRDYIELGELRHRYGRSPKYGDEEKKAAIEYYLAHGRNIAATVRALGYPNRDKLRAWIREALPGIMTASSTSDPPKLATEQEKRRAVVDLCSRESAASAVAQCYGVSRVTLYKWKHELLGTGDKVRAKDTGGKSLSKDRDELEQEVERLEKQIHRLQLEHDILKKANELLKEGQGISPLNLSNREKTLLVDALRTTSTLTELLEHVRMPRSSYFYHESRLRVPDKYTTLRSAIRDVFTANKSCYGYRRIQVELQRSGSPASEKVIRRLMTYEGLVVLTTRRRRYSSYSGEISPAVENVIDRDFHASAPNQKWLTDITEFQLPAGKAYLSPIIDCIDGMVVSWIGAGKHERSGDRSTHRNGYRARLLEARMGTMNLKTPKLRSRTYSPSFLEPRTMSEAVLVTVVQEAYVKGISTRKVDDLVQAMGMSGISKSQVSKICGELNGRVKEFLSREITGELPYLWLDATHLKSRDNHHVVSRALVVAVGVNEEGRREALGIACGPAETEAFCTEFLRCLSARGLGGVRLVISDAHQGLKNATVIRTAFVQETTEDALATWRETADRLRDRFQSLAALTDDAEQDVLGFMRFPKEHWKQIASTNPLERVSKEIKRRANVVGIFPNDASMVRLVGSLVIEQTEQWHLTRRYMSYGSLAKVLKPESPGRLLGKQAVA